MSDEKKPLPPMSIEQAGNYLAEKQETLADDIKKEASDMPISYALPEDMRTFLRYSMSLLDRLDPATMKALPVLGLSAEDGARLLKKLLQFRIDGCSREQIAHFFKVKVDIIRDLEVLAIRAIQEEISRRRMSGIPILGG